MDRKTLRISTLHFHPDNARTHDIGLLVESLERHGQYRPLVVQKRTKHVLAGNGTLEAMRYLGWTEAVVDLIDVDDRQAKEILAVDNKATDHGGYDPEALTQLIVSFDGDYAGTGYTDREAQALLDEATERERAISTMLAHQADDITRQAGPEEDITTARVLNADEDVLADEHDAQQVFEDDQHRVVMLNADVHFMPGAGQWNMPELRSDLLLDDLPRPITTWVGPSGSEQHNGSYMYVYSTDSTREMPWDRTALCFYINDERFESWWQDPARYVMRLVDAGIMAMVEHDFSPYDGHPQAVWLWNMYRTRWLARFAQEAGISVIPNLPWFTDTAHAEWALSGWPKEIPVCATQVQTHSGEARERAARARHHRWLKHVARQHDIGTLLVYGTPETYDRIVVDAKLGIETVYVENRTTRWSHLKREWKITK
jgi:ParB-like chromosome segregation protein Spo0J